MAGIATPRDRGARPEALTVARLPSILMGAIGCVAIFLLGVLVKDEPAGWIAAVLLAVNPLYRLHAHRAMSEAPCEAFLLLSLAVGIRGWRGDPGAAVGGAGLRGPASRPGLLAGLAILAKFNGVLALFMLRRLVPAGLGLPRDCRSSAS